MLQFLKRKKTDLFQFPKLAKRMGGGRDWLRICAIYGSDDWHTVIFLLLNSVFFALTSIVNLLLLVTMLQFFHDLCPSISFHALRLAVNFTGCFAGLISLCLLFAAGNVLYSSLSLRRRVIAHMVAVVPDWSTIRTALDVGYGHGILLNVVIGKLKNSGSPVHVVGLNRRRETAVDALPRATAKGVQKYVTCWEGDAYDLPFGGGWFDVVVSEVDFSGLGKTTEEKGLDISEMVRVLRPGGVGMIWDLGCMPEFVTRLREMRMEDIEVSERFTAYMASSQIVSFKKPVAASPPETLDWRVTIY